MFTARKLEQLPKNQRARKLVQILQLEETKYHLEKTLNTAFLLNLLQSPAAGDGLSTATIQLITEAVTLLRGDSNGSEQQRELIFAVNRIRHSLLHELGMEPAEWDLLIPQDETLVPAERTTLPFTLYLEDIRSPFNVGSIFRTAEAFGVRKIYLSPHTPLPTHRRAMRTGRGTNQLIPWEIKNLQDLEDDAKTNIFALETGGCPITAFDFPAQGLLLIGSEELGLSPQARSWAADRLVSIPMSGLKRSLNVAVATGILLWNWFNRRPG